MYVLMVVSVQISQTKLWPIWGYWHVFLASIFYAESTSYVSKQSFKTTQLWLRTPFWDTKLALYFWQARKHYISRAAVVLVYRNCNRYCGGRRIICCLGHITDAFIDNCPNSYTCITFIRDQGIHTAFIKKKTGESNDSRRKKLREKVWTGGRHMFWCEHGMQIEYSSYEHGVERVNVSPKLCLQRRLSRILAFPFLYCSRSAVCSETSHVLYISPSPSRSPPQANAFHNIAIKTTWYWRSKVLSAQIIHKVVCFSFPPKGETCQWFAS